MSAPLLGTPGEGKKIKPDHFRSSILPMEKRFCQSTKDLLFCLKKK